MGALKDSQMTMARYLRDPGSNPPPQGVEQRRLKVYEDLIYRNIEGFISSGFPVLRSLYNEDDWHSLVRRFIDNHRCHTPYFLEISQEFIQFLLDDDTPGEKAPPFQAELAHYEWVELALDVAEDELPPAKELAPQDMFGAVPALSPLAWVLSYRYPVHRIGAAFQPEAPGDPVFLVVYRDRDDRVQFMELNATTARLLELVRDNQGQTVETLLAQLAGEIKLAPEAIAAAALEQLADFSVRSVVLWR